MKTVNLEELLGKLNEIGGCDAKYAYEIGWDKAIDEVISIVEGMASEEKKTYKTYHVGDKIKVCLTYLGTFDATVQRVNGRNVTFMFDDCITMLPMNCTNTNTGGYEASGLCYWFNTVLKSAFPDELKERLIDISIPTYGQVFGHDKFYSRYLVPDDDEQFELMKRIGNHVADYNGEPEWYWLQNATKESVSSGYFTSVCHDGSAYYNYASYSYGVRPVFTLFEKEEK